MSGYIAVVFNGKRTAGKALDTLEESGVEYPWVDDVAVVQKNHLGAIKVNSTWAQADSATGASAGLGALTGGLVGMLFGPGGALAGAAISGALGGLFGAAANASIADPRLDAFASALTHNTSALIVVGDESELEAFAAAPMPAGGQVFKSDLSAGDIKKIKKALKQDD